LQTPAWIVLETASWQTFSWNYVLQKWVQYKLSWTIRTRFNNYAPTMPQTLSNVVVDSIIPFSWGSWYLWRYDIVTGSVKSEDTNLYNITQIKTNDNILIPEWQKAHIVLAQEWDEVDPARYFKVGLVDKNTTTRNCKFFDGTNWVDNNPAENNVHWVTLSSTSKSQTAKYWLKLKAKKDLQINSINLVSGGSQPTKAYIEYPIWTTVETANITALVATFTWTTIIPAGENFAIVVDNDWWTFTNYYGIWTFPYSFNYLDITSGYRSVWRLENIESINVTAVWWFSYSSSDLFANSLLSLTDATYSYKLPNDIVRFAKSDWAIGEKVKCAYKGIADLFTGLTTGSDYFLQDTPWTIGATAGTNPFLVINWISSAKWLITSHSRYREVTWLSISDNWYTASQYFRYWWTLIGSWWGHSSSSTWLEISYDNVNRTTIQNVNINYTSYLSVPIPNNVYVRLGKSWGGSAFMTITWIVENII